MANSSLLTILLPSTSYLLAYTLPLLFLSLLLTFAGAFLSLDRTRSFSHYDAVPGLSKKRKFGWLLEGGVGGLAVGCVFGIHFSTFLALLIPAISTSSALNPKSFLPVWLLSAITTTFVSGRWKYVALAFSGISGGTLIALSLCVIVHPSLTTRVILTAIILPILTIMTLLPLVRFQHAAVRFAMSATGAFGVVLSVALLSHIQAWANVWERYWENDGVSWGTSQEKGLSAAFCLFLCAGMACDWLLRRIFGECPDEKWDQYLADYAANSLDRAGTFQPLHSFWDRLFRSQKTTIFPHNEDVKIDPPLSQGANFPFKLRKHGQGITRHAADKFQSSPAYVKRGQSQFQARWFGRRKEAVKFDNVYSSDEDGDSEDSPVRMSSKTPSLTATGLQRTSHGGKDNEKKARLERIMTGLGEMEVLEYSDFEEDVTEEKMKGDSLGQEWSPGFLRRHQSSSGTAVSAPMSLSSPPLGAVPATQSLIKALDRVAAAQQAAFGSDAGRQSGLPKIEDGGNGARWDEFWKDVRDKARH